MNPDKRRKFNGAHPMHADSNLPRKMSKHARKLLRKRRIEIEDELDDFPDTIDDASPDASPVPRHETNKQVATWDIVEALNGCKIHVSCGNYKKRMLGLNEYCP